MLRKWLLTLCVGLILFRPLTALATEYTFADNHTIIGKVTHHITKPKESLIEIARAYKLGYNEIVLANPDLDPFVPGDNVSVTIPTEWILPNVPKFVGIVINLAEMRLYYFSSPNKVHTFPIGIGDEGNDTPLGTFKIIQKVINPSWTPPQSIRKERPELPQVVPPGPDNPLGSHALRLSLPSYLIHGTNRPWAVGRRATHGCIRLYPEEIPELFKLVEVGTPVSIIFQPIKVASLDDRVFIEVHRDQAFLTNDNMSVNYHTSAVDILRKRGLLHKIDTQKMYQAIMRSSGIPEDITK